MFVNNKASNERFKLIWQLLMNGNASSDDVRIHNNPCQYGYGAFGARVVDDDYSRDCTVTLDYVPVTNYQVANNTANVDRR